MRANAVGVADDRRRWDELPLLRLHAPHPAPLPRTLVDDDPPDRRPGPDVNAKINREARERPRHRAGAAPRIPDAIVRLHVRDPAEHSGRGVGCAADILCEMVEHLRRPFVRHEGPHGTGHGVARPHPHDLLQERELQAAAGVEHVFHAPDASPEEEFVREPVEPLRQRHESGVALSGAGAGGVGVERGLHLSDVGDQIERRAVGEKTPPLRIERDEIEGCFQLAARLGEDSLEHAGNRQDRRPHVEPETLLSEHRSLAADPGIFFAERDRIAASRERAGSRQAAEAAADHDHPVLFICLDHCCVPTTEVCVRMLVCCAVGLTGRRVSTRPPRSPRRTRPAAACGRCR